MMAEQYRATARTGQSPRSLKLQHMVLRWQEGDESVNDVAADDMIDRRILLLWQHSARRNQTGKIGFSLMVKRLLTTDSLSELRCCGNLSLNIVRHYILDQLRQLNDGSGSKVSSALDHAVSSSRAKTHPVHSTGFVIALNIGIICRRKLSPLGSVLLSLKSRHRRSCQHEPGSIEWFLRLLGEPFAFGAQPVALHDDDAAIAPKGDD
jgi:hypothetical protein